MNTIDQKYIVETLKIEVPYRINPESTFYEICGDKKLTLLLESAEINKRNHLQSMMIVDTAIRITILDRIVTFESFTQNGKNILDKIHNFIPDVVQVTYYTNKIKLKFPNYDNELDEDIKLHSLSVFDSFRFILQLITSRKEDVYAIFFGGLFSYDLINLFESLPKVINFQNCPDLCFYLSETLLIIDHINQKSILQGSIFLEDDNEKVRIQQRLIHIKNQLKKYPLNIPGNKIPPSPYKVNFSNLEYQNIISNLKKYILKGEIFQIVPSRRFLLPCPYPLSAYHVLKINNPSPYMFFMQDTDFILFGASPESALKYNPINRIIEIYPIAGTRPRGFDKDGNLDLDLDSRIELEMRTNEKELSEHIMLVDLARNDLAKICVPGTRFVSHLTQVDRYSHVMHLVSKVIGVLKKDLDPLHAYSACMNMGTLTGAPKIRAMQLIAQFERIKRGSYGGAIGYFTESGVLDTCIVIRSAYIENNIATVQSGAGVVLDSIPIEESNESINKAQVVLNSIIQSNYQKV